MSAAALERQLADSQLPTAVWQQMRAAQVVSLVQVRTVTRRDGAPALTVSAAYLRVYATRVTAAIAFAKAQAGKPYVFGAAGPDAYDCSSLLYAAYAAAGIHVTRITYQWQQDGSVIPLSQIQADDLLFYAGSDGTKTNPGHVVMYLGGGHVIQAPRTGEDVQTGPLDLAGVAAAARPADLATTP